MNSAKKILVIRNDKIGDFMLAWPSFALLKTQYPDAEITALVPTYTAALAEQCQWIDKVLIDKKQDMLIKDILQLTKAIKNGNYDASISLFSEARTAMSLWLAGVKTRVAPATKLAQVFINKALKQRRSQSLKPEYEYNLDLVKFYVSQNGHSLCSTPAAPYMAFDDTEIQSIKNTLLTQHSISKNAALIIIHPGTGGSAINLPLTKYAELVNCIAKQMNVYFLITAGPGELENAKNLSKQLNANHHVHYSDGSIIDFCKLICATDIFISGSTGPLHIAGALNLRTVAFYPSKRSATSLRWQTLNDEDKRLAYTLNDSDNADDITLDMNHVCAQVCSTFLDDKSPLSNQYI